MSPHAKPRPLTGPGSDLAADESGETDSQNSTVGKAWQPDLFHHAPDRGTARTSDPATSIEAARSLDPETLSHLQSEVYEVLVARGGEGILDDVVRVTGRQRGSTSRRLTDLEQGGFIRHTDKKRRGLMTGRRQIVWQVVDDG